MSVGGGTQSGTPTLTGAGVGSDSGHADSVTVSGIGVSTSTDTTHTLNKIFDADKVQKEINAQVQITQAFGQRAASAIADYASSKIQEAEQKQTEALIKQQQANKALSEGRTEDAQTLQAEAQASSSQAENLRNLWGETGSARVSLHALAGGLASGVGGIAGATASTLGAPQIDQALSQMGLPQTLKEVLIQGATVGLGAAVGGTTGAAAAGNEVANNYLTSTQQLAKDKELAGCKTLSCIVGTNIKYLGISGMQDTGLLVGVGGGIGYQSVEQAAAIVDLVKNLPETLTALKAIVSDPDFRAKVGDQIADEYKQRIDMQTRAYNDGGWDGSITAGVEAGRLAVDIVAMATAVEGATKLTATIAKTSTEVVGNATTTLVVAVAKTFDKLDVASQTKWLTETASWRAATSTLVDLEAQAGNSAHPLLRHGDQVELVQLKTRSMTGETPDGMQASIPEASTRWLNNEDMLTAIKQAQTEFAKTNKVGPYTWDAGKVVGDGYYAGGVMYSKATEITVVLNSKGMPITAYPKLPKI